MATLSVLDLLNKTVNSNTAVEGKGREREEEGEGEGGEGGVGGGGRGGGRKGMGRKGENRMLLTSATPTLNETKTDSSTNCHVRISTL